MSQKERQRYHLLQMVIDGKNTLKDAGERMVKGLPIKGRVKRKNLSIKNINKE